MSIATLLPGVGPPRLVSLCALCASGRPGRRRPELGPADLAWRVLERDTTRLLAAYEQEQWIPSDGELEFGAGLARMPWSEEAMRTAVREVDSL
ncbi:hypothetical protein ACFY8A_40060, partial [Streptomyces sp. NPDC012746]